jgi:hypothetical protein
MAAMRGPCEAFGTAAGLSGLLVMVVLEVCMADMVVCASLQDIPACNTAEDETAERISICSQHT